jgi:hypothetical protein
MFARILPILAALGAFLGAFVAADEHCATTTEIGTETITCSSALSTLTLTRTEYTTDVFTAYGTYVTTVMEPQLSNVTITSFDVVTETVADVHNVTIHEIETDTVTSTNTFTFTVVEYDTEFQTTTV